MVLGVKKVDKWGMGAINSELEFWLDLKYLINQKSLEKKKERSNNMGRSPCCDESGLKKGPWTPEEDHKLVKYIQKNGHGSWRALPKLAGMREIHRTPLTPFLFFVFFYLFLESGVRCAILIGFVLDSQVLIDVGRVAD